MESSPVDGVAGDGAKAGTAAAGTGGAAERIDPELMRLAAILLVGAIAALLDTTIVNVAIRTIGRDLHAPLGVVQWVMTGYLLSYAMVIPLSGWALARFGGRATWLTALGVFLAASVAAGASVPDASSVTRIMQQVGGSFGTAVLAVILVGHSFQATFWWSVAFTALAVLPALMLPRRAAGSGTPG